MVLQQISLSIPLAVLQLCVHAERFQHRLRPSAQLLHSQHGGSYCDDENGEQSELDRLHSQAGLRKKALSLVENQNRKWLKLHKMHVRTSSPPSTLPAAWRGSARETPPSAAGQRHLTSLPPPAAPRLLQIPHKLSAAQKREISDCFELLDGARRRTPRPRRPLACTHSLSLPFPGWHPAARRGVPTLPCPHQPQRTGPAPWTSRK